MWNLPVGRNVNLGILTSCYSLPLPHRSPRAGDEGNKTAVLGLFQSQKKINYHYFLYTFPFGKWPKAAKALNEPKQSDNGQTSPPLLLHPASLWSSSIWATTAPYSDRKSGLSAQWLPQEQPVHCF